MTHTFKRSELLAYYEQAEPDEKTELEEKLNLLVDALLKLFSN